MLWQVTLHYVVSQYYYVSIKTLFFGVVVPSAICKMGKHHKPFNVPAHCACGPGLFGPFYQILVINVVLNVSLHSCTLRVLVCLTQILYTYC